MLKNLSYDETIDNDSNRNGTYLGADRAEFGTQTDAVPGLKDGATNGYNTNESGWRSRAEPNLEIDSISDSGHGKHLQVQGANSARDISSAQNGENLETASQQNNRNKIVNNITN